MYREGVVGEELVCRISSKWEKVVNKATFVTLGHKLIICNRSVSWWEEELHHLVKDRRAFFAQGLNNDSNSSDCLRTRGKKFSVKIKCKYGWA